MDRPFLTYQQRPYDSPIALLHELRAVCENALDLHPMQNDPVHSSARDVHDFLEELLMEQDANMKEAADARQMEASSSTSSSSRCLASGHHIDSSPSTSGLNSAPSVVPQLNTVSAQNLNVVLMNEILNQRQLTAHMGFQLLQALIPPTPLQPHLDQHKDLQENEDEYWERNSESEDESSEIPEAMTSSASVSSFGSSVRPSTSRSGRLARIGDKRTHSE